MANTIKPFFRGAATTNTSTTLYTTPAATTAVVTNVLVTNTTNSSGTFTLFLNDVSIATTVTVGALDSTILDIKQALNAGQTIKGGASATTINFHISGIEIA